MLGVDWIFLVVFLFVIFILVNPIGTYLYKVLNPKERTFLDPVLKPIENIFYKIIRIDTKKEQDWKRYLVSVLGFGFISFLFTAVILSLQYYLPFNPQKFSAPNWDLNVNTSLSFMSNTNWQNYGGESTMSYVSQMASLAVQNFVSAGMGLSCAAALVRGIARKSAKTIGNFWVDLVRICLYLLLPFSIVAAVLFLFEGVPQNFNAYVTVETIEGGFQTIAQGPIASQEAIKLIGSNGGGFMNVNSAHPYENPTPLSNALQMILIFLFPAAQIYYFGKEIRNTRHAWCIIAALTFMFLVGVVICSFAELGENPEWSDLGLSGGNWEGKEQRIGVFGSSLFACVTTSASCGAVNCMHDSLTPIGGMISMLNIQLSEVIFGAIGTGLYSVLLFVFLTIFISGLIIGRTPEYLGKKIESFDIKMTVLAILPYIFFVHAFTSWACFSSWGIDPLGNRGPHGFSEILYAFSSCGANNGSAFAGLSGNTLMYNLTLGAAMLLGRFLVIAPVIALAGSFAMKKVHQKTASSFPVSSFVFISLLVGVVVLIGALTFLPALTMGPVLDEFFMLKGVFFP